jgi:hypothetical protein
MSGLNSIAPSFIQIVISSIPAPGAELHVSAIDQVFGNLQKHVIFKSYL